MTIILQITRSLILIFSELESFIINKKTKATRDSIKHHMI